MESSLQAEIKQGKPFAHVREEAFLNLLRTAAILGHEMEQIFKPHGLSSTQYNVLRILRGAGECGLCQFEIAERLVAQVPDVPRILDRMEVSGWVQRERGASDRRIRMATLTEAGLELVISLDEATGQAMQWLFPHLDEDQVVQFNHLLVAARGGV